jgi:hypothetical protein
MSSFKTAMSRHASREERRVALLRARQHGLNIRLIANAVVRPLMGIVQVSLHGSQEVGGLTAALSISSSWKLWVRIKIREEPPLLPRRKPRKSSVHWNGFSLSTKPTPTLSIWQMCAYAGCTVSPLELLAGNIWLSLFTDSRDVSAVRKLEESLPQDLIETCQAAQRRIVEENPHRDQADDDLEDNDAAIEQNIIELRFHLLLRDTIDTLGTAETQWDGGPAGCLPGWVSLQEETTRADIHRILQ